MRQAWLVAQWDWRRLWRGGAATIVGVLFLLVALAAAAGLSRVQAERRSRTVATTREADFRRALREPAGAATTGPHEPATLAWDRRNPDFLANDHGTFAVAPPPPLLALSIGRTSVFPSEIKVTAAGPVEWLAASELAHPLAQALGPFDVQFVIVFLWPLAIIAIASDAVAGERDRGTLALLLAQPVSPTALVAGWLLARGAAVALPVLIVPLLALLLAPPVPPLFALSIWVMAVTAYGAFWLGLTAWVASRASSGAATAMWLGGAWLLVALIGPGVIELAASSAGNLPSEVTFADATRAATRDALSDGSRVLGHFLEDHPTEAAVGRDGLRQFALLQAARDLEVARRLSPLRAQFELAVARQQRVVSLLAPLSPALVAADLCEQAAGTSRERGRDVLAQVERFRETWRAFLTPRIMAGVALTGADAAALPMFTYVEEPPSAVVGRTWRGLAWLLGLGLGFAWAAVIRLAHSPLGQGRT